MPADLPSPICRLPRCAGLASTRGGFCTAHGIRYVLWRSWRDELERRDLDDVGAAADGPIDPFKDAALDALFAWLTPGPFPELDAAEGLLIVVAPAVVAAAPLRPR